MGAELTPHTESCRICGAELEYLEEARAATCTVCGHTDNAHVVCPQEHYVCDGCHGAAFLEDLGRGLDEAGSASPHEIAEDLMALPNLPMLGCEHAHIAAGSLMRALENAGVEGVTAAHRVEALERTARQAVGAYCGLTGVCGVVPALGACYSVLVGGACGKGAETRGAMQLVSRLAAVTAEHADPGCCKAYVRAGLRETATFLEEHLGITTPPPPGTVCADAERHPHGCRGSECDWHPDHPAESHFADHEEATVTESNARDGGPSMANKGDDRRAGATGTSGPAQRDYDRFFDLAYADGALDAKTKILISLGASLAAGCAP